MPKAIRNVKAAILKVLAENEKLTWLQIQEKAMLSKGALSTHLNDLIDKSVIRTSTIDSRPPSTLYSLVEPKLESPIIFHTIEKYEKFISSAANTAFQTGVAIRNLEDRNLAKDVLKGYLDTNTRWIMSITLSSMIMANAFSKGYEEKTQSSRLARLLPGKKRDQVYMDQMRKKLRKLVDPWIEAIANTAFINMDIAYDMSSGAIVELCRNLTDQVNVDWFDYLEKERQ